LPAAIPLVHQSNYQWNKEEGTLVPVVAKDEAKTKLQLLPEALELLKTVGKPVAVLAICGPYRSGKSFFISRVVEKPGTFKLGHSMEACTRGIWLSTTALECDEFVLLVLDTEGIGAVEGEGPESFTTKLLVATILLSSFLIYNSTEVPKQADLQQMSSFAHLSTAINVREKKQNDPIEFQNFPKFMWLLRDVTNPPYDDEEEDENSALSKYLTEVVLTPTGQKDCDTVIAAITTLFPQPLLCDWLLYPNDDPQNSNLDDEDNIDEEFTEQSDQIINGEHGIKASILPKVGFDQQLPVTGGDLAELARLYIKAINQKGSVPSLEGSWKAVIKLKLTKEAEALVAKYEQENSAGRIRWRRRYQRKTLFRADLH
jgi:hypothetical protein